MCAAKVELVLTLPRMSRERENAGPVRAQVITESLGDGRGLCGPRASARSDDVFLPDQFSNPANPDPPAHHWPEIERLWRAARRAGRRVGTRGTITGTRDYLRERNRSCGWWRWAARLGCPGHPRAAPHQSIGAGFSPVLNRELLDEVIAVCDDDAIHTA